MISGEVEAGWITKPLWCWPANDIASSKSVPFLKFKLRSWDYDHKGITNEISFHRVRFSCTLGVAVGRCDGGFTPWTRRTAAA